jgi:hypothetical protein
MIYTPTFLLFDSAGSEVRRDVGLPDVSAVGSWLDQNA